MKVDVRRGEVEGMGRELEELEAGCLGVKDKIEWERAQCL